MRHEPPVTLSSEQWRGVFAAADHALELSSDERETFIARCCADDPALGAGLRALLSSGEARSALDSPASAFAGPILADRDPDPELLSIPARIGPYRVTGTLGSGGMGTVYLADRDDDQYHKRIALKVLPRWSAGHKHRIRRFLEERQILAVLEHSDIARLLDGGITPDGLPWFAMEYVQGEPIDRYCDEARLSIEARLDLFCRVCAAVQYAHRNLIVHRDLKPANILVSHDGAVKLLDFGIAKLMDEGGESSSTVLTQTDDRMMTPLYASPEQVRGERVSTTSDVYALGVLLYRLLVGRHPYVLPTRQPHEVARAILEQEPVLPSAAVREHPTRSQDLSRRLHGDLDAIVLKAMEKNPQQRYGSAEQLEADLRRHLAGLPVAVRPATRLYQARKFIRRHRVGVTATAIGVLLVLGFSLITVVQSVRIRREVARVAAERDRAEAVQSHLLRVFGSAVPSPGDGRGVTALEVLDSSAARVEGDLSGQPDVRARLLFGLGRSYRDLGDYPRARNLLEASVALWRGTPTDGDEMASTLAELGSVLVAQGEPDSAERVYQEALRLRRRVLGERHNLVGRTMNGLATAWLDQERYAEAESLSRRALSIHRSGAAGSQVDLGQSLRGVGHALFARSEYGAAASHYSEALSLLRGELSPDHLEIVGTVWDLAAARRGMGDTRAADSLFREGLALQRRMATTLALSVADSSWFRPLTPPSPPRTSDRSDGSRIFFISDRVRPDPVASLGHHEIYSMNPDGSDQRRVTHTDGRLTSPAISPDGSRIAFFTTGRPRASEIFTIDAQGGQPTRLTRMTELGMGARAPDWAPDGKRLAFQSAAPADIWVINLDGTGLQQLTFDKAPDATPAWSPDGRRIAFVSQRAGKPDVYVMNADGTDQTQVTFGAVLQAEPNWSMRVDWSPDGRRLAFTSDRDGNREIYLINADGTGLTRLTNDPAEDWKPAWSPDGRQIAFSRRVLGHLQVFVISADGGTPTRITEPSGASFNGFPDWGPAPPQRPASNQTPR